MFRELARLREAESKLKAGKFGEALDIVREPGLSEHRRAVDVRSAARNALKQRAVAASAEGKFGEAADLLVALKRDGHDDLSASVEKALREARRDSDSAAAARDMALREARRAAGAGEREKARSILAVTSGPEAKRLALVVDEEERREAAWRKNVAEAIAKWNPALLEAAFDDLPAAGSASPVVRDAMADAIAAGLKRGDASTTARLWRKAREGGFEPTEATDAVAECCLESARRGIREADLAMAGVVLGVFPVGKTVDDEALRLRRAVWAWQRGREAFRRGQDAVGKVLYDEADASGPKSAAREQERNDASAAARRMKEAAAEARSLASGGRLVEARRRLSEALKDAPSDHVATELLAALDLDLKRDFDAAAEAREALAALDLRTARRVAAGLSLRRRDMAEVELLLQEIDARSERALLDAIDAERRTILTPPPPQAARPQGRSVEKGEPFLMRIENEGDWLVCPTADLWIGSAAKRQSDLLILAPIGGRHARIERTVSPDGSTTYRIHAGEGHPVTVNKVDTKIGDLADGDLVALGRAVAFSFIRPGNKGGSACLRIHGDHAVSGCSRVALFCESGRNGAITVGSGAGTHISLRNSDERFEVFRADDGATVGGLLVRSPRGVSADGQGERAQVRATCGVIYSVGETRFYFDPAPVDRP